MSQTERISGEDMQLLQKELSLYEQDGILLKLNGKPSDARTIVAACTVTEEGSYMRDYVEDDQGRFIQLGFDWIQEK